MVGYKPQDGDRIAIIEDVAVLGQIPLHPGQHGVVDIHPAVHLPVVEAVHDIPDGDDGIDLDAVVLPQLVQGGAVGGDGGGVPVPGVRAGPALLLQPQGGQGSRRGRVRTR